MIFIIGALATLLASIDSSIVSVALPVFTADFETSLIVAGWTISIYQLVLTATLPLAGKISDVMGRKSTFVVSVAFFTAASLLCSVAPTVEILIACRFIQAVGGSGLIPSVTGILADIFPQSRQKMVGLIATIFPFGLIVGPNLGGWLASTLGWRSLFWVNVPIGIVVLVASIMLLPTGVKKSAKIDLAGAGLLGLFLISLMAGLSLLGSAQTRQFSILVLLFGISAAALIFLWRHESRTAEPILDIELMKTRPFLAANIFNIIYGASVIGVCSLIPTYAVSVYGMSTLASGAILTPNSITMAVASLVVSGLLIRVGYRKPMLIGISIMSVSLILLGFEFQSVNVFGFGISHVAFIIIIMLLLGTGNGINMPAANNSCIDLMPESVATITALRAMFRQSGAALGVTVSTLVLELVGDMGRGFTYIMLGAGIILLLSIFAVMVMPRSAQDNYRVAKDSARAQG